MKITIDQHSGFCFGVVNAIKKVEEVLQEEETLYCLGDIVHNSMEVKRLESLGLITINQKKYRTLSNCKVLLRAHGEPPSTYEYARKNNIQLIDATCPVVLKLQQHIKATFKELKKQNGQLVIFGKPGHAEVIGLNGQTGNQAIIIKNPEESKILDLSKPTELFSQTTQPIEKFNQLAYNMQKNASKGQIKIHDTICRQVSNRAPKIKEFASQHEIIIFVGGEKSSNARVLFEECKQSNPYSYFISSPETINKQWLSNINTVGICGATSTPLWLMEEVKTFIQNL